MSTVSASVPVRHGRCRLTLTINDVSYSLRRHPSNTPGAKIWRLQALAGPRRGMLYSVVAYRGQLSCTCPDDVRNGAFCKHARALRAAGVVNRRLRPANLFVAENLRLASAAAEAAAPCAEGGV